VLKEEASQSFAYTAEDKHTALVKAGYYSVLKQLEGCESRQKSPGSTWHVLFSRIKDLKSLGRSLSECQTVSGKYWELQRRTVISRALRDDRGLLDLVLGMPDLSKSESFRFYELGRGMLEAIKCEALVHIYDLKQSESTTEERIGITESDLIREIFDSYENLLLFYDKSVLNVRNPDDAKFPVDSFVFSRVISLIEAHFKSRAKVIQLSLLQKKKMERLREGVKGRASLSHREQKAVFKMMSRAEPVVRKPDINHHCN
jgi:hypothetical protein